VKLEDLPAPTLFQKEHVFAQDNVLYSTYKPSDLYMIFEEGLIEQDIQYQKDEKKWKITLEHYREKQEDLDLPQEGIRVKVKFNKVDDQRVAIEFTRLAGSAVLFHEKLADFKSKLSQYVDTTA